MFSAYNIILWNIKAQTKFQVKTSFSQEIEVRHKRRCRIYGTSACNCIVVSNKKIHAIWNTHNTINKIINMLLGPAYD